jgi:hypothetical protein
VSALADRARQLAESHPPRTPERRAATGCWAALVTTRTAAAARRALGTISDPAARAAAVAVLDDLEQEKP